MGITVQSLQGLGDLGEGVEIEGDFSEAGMLWNCGIQNILATLNSLKGIL